jgi:hypothetical protein
VRAGRSKNNLRNLCVTLIDSEGSFEAQDARFFKRFGALKDSSLRS